MRNEPNFAQSNCNQWLTANPSRPRAPGSAKAGRSSPLADKKPYDIDLVVIRENTEGEYANIGGFVYEGQPDEVAIQTSVFTRRGCERVIRYAFELARKRDAKKHLTSVTKSNALAYMTLWDRTFDVVAAEYPDIERRTLLVDAACMEFIRRPEMFDVVVASNLFGDILTDIGAMITGSLGLASGTFHGPVSQIADSEASADGHKPCADPRAQVS